MSFVRLDCLSSSPPHWTSPFRIGIKAGRLRHPRGLGCSLSSFPIIYINIFSLEPSLLRTKKHVCRIRIHASLSVANVGDAVSHGWLVDFHRPSPSSIIRSPPLNLAVSYGTLRLLAGYASIYWRPGWATQTTTSVGHICPLRFRSYPLHHISSPIGFTRTNDRV